MDEPTPFPDCPICHNRRHVRTETGWTRCTCATRLLSTLYISPKIRQADTNYPPEYADKDPYPLRDLTLTGDFTHVRFRIWRSLEVYEAQRLTYVYLDAYRLVEIELDKDETFNRVRDLVVFDLIIILLGVVDAPNRRIAPLLGQALTQRQQMAKPTWVYVQAPDRVAHAYTPDLHVLLKPNLYEEVPNKVDANAMS